MAKIVIKNDKGYYLSTDHDCNLYLEIEGEMTGFDVRRVCEHELEMLKEEQLTDPNNVEIQERIIEVTHLLNTMDD